MKAGIGSAVDSLTTPSLSDSDLRMVGGVVVFLTYTATLLAQVVEGIVAACAASPKNGAPLSDASMVSAMQCGMRVAFMHFLPTLRAQVNALLHSSPITDPDVLRVISASKLNAFLLFSKTVGPTRALKAAIVAAVAFATVGSEDSEAEDSEADGSEGSEAKDSEGLEGSEAEASDTDADESDVVLLCTFLAGDEHTGTEATDAEFRAMLENWHAYLHAFNAFVPANTLEAEVVARLRAPIVK